MAALLCSIENVDWGKNMDRFETELDLKDALVLKRAEMWLDVGRPMLALQEMEGLGGYSWGHPWVIRVLDAICTTAAPPGVKANVPFSVPVLPNNPRNVFADERRQAMNSIALAM
jgi:hypothetical protein